MPVSAESIIPRSNTFNLHCPAFFCRVTKCILQPRKSRWINSKAAKYFSACAASSSIVRFSCSVNGT